MDTITFVKELIFNGLFPIAMCGVLAWYIKYQKDTYTEQINNLVTTIDKLADALTKLQEKIQLSSDYNGKVDIILNKKGEHE